MRSKRIRQWLIWGLIALIGAASFAGIALNRGEAINAAWLVVAAACVYLLAYRFYSGWIAARVVALDATRATPAESLENGRDFMPTNRWIVFGHHFAARWSDTCGAVRLSARHPVAAGRSGAGRLCAGHAGHVLLGAPQWARNWPDGTR